MKVLIVSHNCFSTTQSMGKTFASLFSEFAADELMQLYLYPTLPNTAQCTNLFRITDREILNSLQHHNQKCGRVIHPDELKSDNALYENSAISEAVGILHFPPIICCITSSTESSSVLLSAGP